MCVLLIGYFYMQNQREAADRIKCQQTLRALSSSIQLYANDYGGELPQNMQVIAQPQDIPDSIMVCPSHQRPHTGWAGTMRECEYIYIYWPKAVRASLPPGTQLPLMYDRNIADHGSHGICIVFENGSTKWDPDASWLKSFAAAHPEVSITIPK